MKSVFELIQKYAEIYNVKESRSFNQLELSQISQARIVVSRYGLSCCFHMNSGCQQYIPLSRDSSGTEGDTVDPTKITLITLEREGEEIHRVKIN